jgi:hypothetical protein
MTTAEQVKAQVRHPLDPLTAEEIEAVGRILRRDRGLAPWSPPRCTVPTTSTSSACGWT